MSLLAARNLRYAYDRSTPVLEDVSFQVDSGVNLGLVGESGAGKTTLLRLLLGLLSPDSGSVLFEDVPIVTKDRASMRAYRRSVQTVFQDPYSSLDPRQSVESIVSEPLRALRIDVPTREASAEALAAVGLPADVLPRYPHEFSGGQRQRIAIARAIVANPRVVLADEPVSALDLSTRIRIIDLLRSLSKSLTIVMVSHDLAVIAAMCPKTVVLDRGRVVEHGNTRDILRSPSHLYTKRLLASIPRLPGASSP